MLTGLCLVLIVAGCAQIPRHSVVENSSPVEIPSTPPTQANGSIYQARFGFQPLFEDRRPRQIGARRRGLTCLDKSRHLRLNG